MSRLITNSKKMVLSFYHLTIYRKVTTHLDNRHLVVSSFLSLVLVLHTTPKITGFTLNRFLMATFEIN